jgi:hypothetical protein
VSVNYPGILDMASTPKGKRGGKASKGAQDGGEARRNVVSIRGTEAWREWLMGLARHRRLAAADVIDQALVEYAKVHGYNIPPPLR